MPLPKVPQDSESLHIHINRVQNRYKYRDQGIDQNLIRNMKAHYYACISFIDYQIGRILKALEDAGQLDNTLILFSADHGELLGDYNCFGKRSMHDSCQRIPMLARYPKRFQADSICNRPVNLVDIMPTMLDAAGVDYSALNLDGVDLAAIANGSSDRTTVYSQFNERENGVYVAINERYKYCYSAPDHQEFLFDRQLDPDETRNRAHTPFMDDALQTMRQTMISHIRETDQEHLLEGGAWREYPRGQISTDPDEGLLIQDCPGFSVDVPEAYRS